MGVAKRKDEVEGAHVTEPEGRKWRELVKGVPSHKHRQSHCTYQLGFHIPGVSQPQVLKGLAKEDEEEEARGFEGKSVK